MDPSQGDCFDFRRLFYISFHSGTKVNFNYARNRVIRDLLDSWLEKKMSFAGVSFTDEAVKLSEEELRDIPGSEVTKSADKLKLEVCIRKGSAIELHPDQIKNWRSHGPAISEAFEALLAKHDKNFKHLLAGVVLEDAGSPATGATGTGLVGPVIEEEKDEEEPGGALIEMESVEKLQSEDAIKFRAMSEIADVELLRTQTGKTWVVAVKKAKTLVRHSLLGGFGTGKLLAFSLSLILFELLVG